MARGHSYNRAKLQQVHRILICCTASEKESGPSFWLLAPGSSFPLKTDTEMREIRVFSCWKLFGSHPNTFPWLWKPPSKVLSSHGTRLHMLLPFAVLVFHMCTFSHKHLSTYMCIERIDAHTNHCHLCSYMSCK